LFWTTRCCYTFGSAELLSDPERTGDLGKISEPASRVPEITCQYRLFALLGAMYNMGYSSLKAGPKNSSTNNCAMQLHPGNELLEAYFELGELAVVIKHSIQLSQSARIQRYKSSGCGAGEW
jgi:hypothetical protein